MVLKWRWLCILAMIFIIGVARSSAQTPEVPQGDIQIFTGEIGQNDGRVYELRDLQVGDTLYILMENTGGSLDPYLQLFDNETYELLMEDDDGGGGWNASLTYTITTPQLLFINLRASLTSDTATYGQFRLTLGVNAPEVLTDTVTPQGAHIADFAGAFIASDRQRVQELEGYLTASANHYYLVEDLQRGDTLYIYVENMSGNFDPYIDVSLNGSDEILAADDDSGDGLDSALAIPIPEDGDYLVMVENCCAEGDGHYWMLIGINSPAVMTGQAIPTGHEVAWLDKNLSQISVSVQELLGHWQPDLPTQTYELPQLNEGDILYAYFQITDGDAIPKITINNFADKTLATATRNPTGDAWTLEYEITEGGDDYTFNISQVVDNGSDPKVGVYHLLVGLNVRSILDGDASPMGEPLFRAPIPIQIDLALLQLAQINQTDHTFTAVMTLHASWDDPSQAFNPNDCRCTSKQLTEAAINAYLSSAEIMWPAFYFSNQQGERQAQQQTLTITSTGQLTYAERFTATFQAPHLDFRQYPFERQPFWIELAIPFSSQEFLLTVGDTVVADRLGQDEWYITARQVNATVTRDNQTHYRFSFWMERHTSFYLYRVLLPLGLLIWLGWLIFFVEHYILRALVFGGHFGLLMLLNATLDPHLPRLPYLTFVDALLLVSFGITSLMILLNVYMAWAVTAYGPLAARRVDRAIIALYPAGYTIIIGLLVIVFFY